MTFEDGFSRVPFTLCRCPVTAKRMAASSSRPQRMLAARFPNRPRAMGLDRGQLHHGPGTQRIPPLPLHAKPENDIRSCQQDSASLATQLQVSRHPLLLLGYRYWSVQTAGSLTQLSGWFVNKLPFCLFCFGISLGRQHIPKLHLWQVASFQEKSIQRQPPSEGYCASTTSACQRRNPLGSSVSPRWFI